MELMVGVEDKERWPALPARAPRVRVPDPGVAALVCRSSASEVSSPEQRVCGACESCPSLTPHPQL